MLLGSYLIKQIPILDRNRLKEAKLAKFALFTINKKDFKKLMKYKRKEFYLHLHILIFLK